MATLEDQIQNPKFNNWIKSALTLNFAREAVKEFVKTENKTHHVSLIENISVVSHSCTFEINSLCKDKTCQHEELTKRIINSHIARKPSLGNTNPKDCWSQPWEYAKCFMQPLGNRNMNTAEDTDLPGLISVITNSWNFKKCLQAITSSAPDIFNQARDVRNAIMHNSTFEVDEKKFQHYTDVVKKMLDSIPLTEETKSSLSRIDELIGGSLTISAEDIARVINNSIESLRLLKDEINHSISGMTILTKKIEDQAIKGVHTLEFKVKDGVLTIERETKESVQRLNEETNMGIACIKKGKAEAADEISYKKNEGIDAIASTVKAFASHLQQKTQDIEELMNDKYKELSSDIEKIYKTKSESVDVKEELDHNIYTLEKTTISCMKTLSAATKECMQILRQQTEKCATALRDANTLSEHDQTNTEKISEFSGTNQENEKDSSTEQSREQRVIYNSETDLENDIGTFSITGMVKVNVDRLAVVDSLKDRVMIINVHGNTIISSIFAYKPFDITCINDTELVVSCGETLKSFNLKDDTLHLGEIRCHLQDRCFGVDYTHVEALLIVSTANAVRMFNMEGNTVREIQLQMTGPGQLKSVYINFSNDASRIYVADSRCKHILCLNSKDGSILQRYDNAKLEGPSGLAVDKAGNVYIAGYMSDNIHILSPDGIPVSIFLDKFKSIEHPTAITYSDKEHSLYVSQSVHGKNIVTVHLIQ